MKLTKTFLAAVLFVVGMALYATSFGNAMFWDDDDFILHNQYIQNVEHLPKLFTENVIAGSGLVSDYWRPVLLLVFSLEWHVWGDAVTGWHVVNALFHALNGVLLFALLLRLLDNQYRTDRTNSAYGTYGAFFVALIFLVHPVQVEAVAYVNSLGDSLSTCFMLSGLVLYTWYLRMHRTGAYVGAVVLFPLALMSKETAIIFPGLLVLVDACMLLPTTRSSGVRRWASGAIARVSSFLLIALVYAAARVTVLNFKNSLNLYNQATAYTESVWIRLLTFFKVLLEYGQLMVWPRVLHMERHMESATSLADAQVLAGASMLIALAGVAIWGWRRGNHLLPFGFLWFLVALAPTSNIAVPINGVLYEHWLYVPLIGLGVFVMGLGVELGGYWRDWTYGTTRTYRSYALLWVGALVAVALCTRSVLRIREWADPVRFYTQTAQHAPHSYRIANNLAMELADRGDLAASIPHYQRAITLDPQNPVGQYNLGNTYAALGDVQQAVVLYERALAADGSFVYAYRPLIGVYLQTQNTTRVQELLDLYVRFRGGLEADLQQVQNMVRRDNL